MDQREELYEALERLRRPSPFVSIEVAALTLALPQKYLKAEIEAGRLPYLQVGRRRVVNVRDVGRALREQARGGADDAQRAARVR